MKSNTPRHGLACKLMRPIPHKAPCDCGLEAMERQLAKLELRMSKWTFEIDVASATRIFDLEQEVQRLKHN